MGYLGNLFVSIDQLGNAVAGGNADNTISARIGYYCYHYYPEKGIKVPFKWRFFRWVVDTSFYPIDGKQHCHEAFFSDAGEAFDSSTKDWVIAVLSILIIGSCIPIFIFLHLLWLLRIVKPRVINREKFIQKRLVASQRKLQGILYELEHDSIQTNDVLHDEVDKVIEKATEVKDTFCKVN